MKPIFNRKKTGDTPHNPSKNLNGLLAYLSHYKYHIVVILGVLLVGFVDENSIMHRIKLQMEIAGLEDEIAKYKAINDKDESRLQELKKNPNAIEKIARERYFMKADNEDIYVLSDDPKAEDTNNSNNAETNN